MSLDTLAAAASFVESEDCKNRTSTRENTSKSPTTSATSDSDSDKTKRRPGGAGTREIHNRLEKNRRAQLKICFETLKNEIPTLQDKRTSNLNILKSALRYIQNLEKKAKEAGKERDNLRKDNISLREKLRGLRNELKAILDANTKNGIKTECHTVPSLPELTATMPDETSLMRGDNVSPVSVATQTMSLAKKETVLAVEISQVSEDEEINVDDVTDT